ncbi:GGDEF domain-containing protein [Frankia sp. CNm7]|uniref:GGDEF domain-containing protein n=1 Tax=Frankia nepalensis TaxID=1836974 RepID=A0A937RLJ6_9ACTN|nr:GGDEF domain-containing protein [Frankia nepalensis]MBL7497652.1 GGDEF domain-containing protein [Frankia nepalensis]MBL7510033.1 GGDEF domain-containing protein [Frankia nepalensis]MBL7517557.1 GGDEF domain-containing protein [Frankia nepalensis]MBL7631054.1 GGDEF domain-containing protein [Frankia nepalensis]
MDRVFAAGGAVGRLMASMDWSATALGPVRDWCPTLRTAVSICLESRFALEVLWGRDFLQVYNDALVTHIGRKHPCLGVPFRETFPELEDDYIPMLNQVLAGRGATWSKDWLLLLDRHGFLEESYFTFSFGPIRRHPGAEVVGVLTATQETTRQVLGTRRLSCLRDLASATVGSRTPGETFTRAVEVLGRYAADIPYCLIAVAAPETPRRLVPVASSGLAVAPSAADHPGGLDPAAAVPELVDALVTDRTRTVGQILERLSLHRTAGTPPSGSAIVIPLSEGGDAPPLGLLLAGISDRLPMDDDYRTFLALAATQITAVTTAARAAEAERAMAADARRRALCDPLTGLPNRVALFERLDQMITDSQCDQQGVAFLFIDLDGFKRVNDTFGHQTGDDLLREVARLLRRVVRPDDTVARLAGDEFAVLCQNLTSSAAVEAVADRIISRVAALRINGDEGAAVTASIGIALTGPMISNADELVCAADTAMYSAKRGGRGRWRHFDRSMPIRLARPRL